MKYLIIILLLFPFFANGQKNWGKRFPEKPDNYVTDQEGVLSEQEKNLLNAKLRDFEDSTSNQLFIYLAKNLHGKDLEDYSKEIFNTWGIGQKYKNNGILIAIFINDRQYRIQIGYGLEGALPSELTRQIQDEEMGPQFKKTNYYAGIDAGIDQLMYYSKNEYTPPSPIEKILTPLTVSYSIGLLFFIINLFSLKKWKNQPTRKRKYLLLNILFLISPIILTAGMSLFSTLEPYFLLLPTFSGTFVSILLSTVMNDKDEIRFDHETDDAYLRRMKERAVSDSSSSSGDSFSGGGGGSSGSGGSSSRW
ncbi:MAG: TPM domain-containing protein [Chryseolinea sp.]